MSAKATALTESGKKFDLLIITPAVSIDRYQSNDSSLFNYSYDDRASSNSNGNSTTNLLSTAPSSRPSWRWCTLICAAVKCFKQHNGNNSLEHREQINQGFLHTYNIADVRTRRTSSDKNMNIVQYQL